MENHHLVREFSHYIKHGGSFQFVFCKRLPGRVYQYIKNSEISDEKVDIYIYTYQWEFQDPKMEVR